MNTSTKTKTKNSAGQFTKWLEDTRLTLSQKGSSNVPCGECTACCHSSYFIHITPEEKSTLAVIPEDLTFPAPGMPSGHRLMGYDDKGRCPMFINNKCSIYDNRPQTCRSYDCRIFPATGLHDKDQEKILVTEQARRWQFAFSSEQDEQHYSALQLAAKFLNQYGHFFPKHFIPSNTTQQAIIAIRVYPIFLTIRDTSTPSNILNIVKKIIAFVDTQEASQ